MPPANTTAPISPAPISAAPISAIVFDIDDVLVAWRPERLYRRLITDDAARARFLGEICSPEAVAGFARQPSTKEAVRRHAERHPDHADLLQAWWTFWPEMFGPALEGSLGLLRALKRRGTPVFALANLSEDAWALASRLYPVLAELDLVVLSGAEGAAKPEPAIYAALEARSGLPPETLLLVDDSAANVAAARARGWRAHRFLGAARLTRELVETGLLTPHETLDARTGDR